MRSPQPPPTEARASNPPAVAVPKPQNPTPHVPITRVCVLAAFGPGRPWAGNLFYESFHRLLSADERIELDLVVMDNTGPDDDGDPWDSIVVLAASDSSSIRRRTILRETTQVDRKRDGAVAVSAHVTRLKNAMLDAVPADADWVLSVEPDVEVPERGETRRAGTCCGSHRGHVAEARQRRDRNVSPEHGSQRVPGTAPSGNGRLADNAGAGWATALRQMIDAAQAAPNIGILGCPIRSRQSKHVMVYRAASLDPWRLDTRNRPRQGASVLSNVDSVSLGLTLIRPSVLRGFRFAATPNADGSGGAGHEWSLMKHARLSGWTVACHWGIQPRHFDTPDKWV